MDGRTEGPTDRPTDQPNDRVCALDFFLGLAPPLAPAQRPPNTEGAADRECHNYIYNMNNYISGRHLLRFACGIARAMMTLDHSYMSDRAGHNLIGHDYILGSAPAANRSSDSIDAPRARGVCHEDADYGGGRRGRHDRLDHQLPLPHILILKLNCTHARTNAVDVSIKLPHVYRHVQLTCG